MAAGKLAEKELTWAKKDGNEHPLGMCPDGAQVGQTWVPPLSFLTLPSPVFPSGPWFLPVADLSLLSHSHSLGRTRLWHSQAFRLLVLNICRRVCKRQ